jgi:hypothetical protein
MDASIKKGTNSWTYRLNMTIFHECIDAGNAERIRRPAAAQRRRPLRGCARMPVGTHPHLLVVGVGSPIDVPCFERLGARWGKSDSCN